MFNQEAYWSDKHEFWLSAKNRLGMLFLSEFRWRKFALDRFPSNPCPSPFYWRRMYVKSWRNPASCSTHSPFVCQMDQTFRLHNWAQKIHVNNQLKSYDLRFTLKMLCIYQAIVLPYLSRTFLSWLNHHLSTLETWAVITDLSKVV